MEDNSHAGQGPVVLDIGGTIGALIVRMPTDLLGVEIEVAPVGHSHARAHASANAHTHSHDHGHDHAHSHDHDPAPSHDHDPGHAHLPHVAVVNRPIDGNRGALVPTLVFSELEEGDYELYQRPTGPVQLRATVEGGAVTQLVWPN